MNRPSALAAFILRPQSVDQIGTNKVGILKRRGLSSQQNSSIAEKIQYAAFLSSRV